MPTDMPHLLFKLKQLTFSVGALITYLYMCNIIIIMHVHANKYILVLRLHALEHSRVDI